MVKVAEGIGKGLVWRPRGKVLPTSEHVPKNGVQYARRCTNSYPNAKKGQKCNDMQLNTGINDSNAQTPKWSCKVQGRFVVESDNFFINQLQQTLGPSRPSPGSLSKGKATLMRWREGSQRLAHRREGGQGLCVIPCCFCFVKIVPGNPVVPEVVVCYSSGCNGGFTVTCNIE